MRFKGLSKRREGDYVSLRNNRDWALAIIAVYEDGRYFCDILEPNGVFGREKASFIVWDMQWQWQSKPESGTDFLKEICPVMLSVYNAAGDFIREMEL